MRNKDRNSRNLDNDHRLERMLQRMAKFAEGGPTVPWPGPNANLAAMRRTAERLRSGALRPPHPSIDPKVAAWVIERGAEQQGLVYDTVAEMKMGATPAEEARARRERERLLHRRAAFHRLKLSPEAQDPGSDAAAKVRRIHRRRRNELGRPGRRRGNESESPRAKQRPIQAPLTFIAGNAQHVFCEPYGTSVAQTLHEWFPAQFRHTHELPWCSAPVEWRGWNELQASAISFLGEDNLPHLLNTDAGMGVYLPHQAEALVLTNIGGYGAEATLDIGGVDGLIDELERFARRRILPIDDAALLEMPDKVDDGDFALLTYAQLLRAAHFARRARLPLWVVR